MIAPRSLTASPASAASPLSGRTPIAATTRSASRSVPSARVTLRGPIAVTPCPSTRSTPAARITSCTGATISGSSGAITWSVASMRVTRRPRWTRFSATSTPMNPPPITAAVRTPSVAAFMASASSTVRSASARSIPGIGGVTGRAPGERTSASYGSSVSSPEARSRACTTRRARSIATASVRTRTSSSKRAWRLAGVCRRSSSRRRSPRRRSTAGRSSRTRRSRSAPGR